MASSVRLGALAMCACFCTLARAEEVYGAKANVVRPLTSTHREDPSAAGTEIDARERAAAHESVHDLLLEVPGARVQRTGALGSFTTASLRGAEVEHTVVLFGDIPISSADAAAFNLSTIPASLLDRVVVYRGGAPVWLSQGAIGGVIQLLPRSAQGTRLAATATAGSLDTYGLAVESSVVPKHTGSTRLLTSAGVLGSQGDFEFEFDNKTSLDASDDRLARRRNADFLDGQGLVHVQQPLGPGELDVLALGFSRASGEPGAPADPAFKSRLSFTRGLLGLGYRIERENARGERVLRLQALGAASYERTRFTDLFHEVTFSGTRTDDESARGFARLAASAAATDFLELTVVGTAQHDLFAPEDALANPPMPDSTRTTLGAAIETNLHGSLASHRFELRPSLRVDRHATLLHTERFGNVERRDAETVSPSYRLASIFEVLPDLTLNASIASGVRAPSILELFGNGALVLGSTSLSSEHSTSYEVGVVGVTDLEDFSGSLELRGFVLDIDDQIIFVRNSTNRLRAQNLAHSRIRGVEVGARTWLGEHFWLNATTTLLDTEGKPGKRLPDRPAVVVFAQPGVTTSKVGPFDAFYVFGETSFISQSYDDPDNGTLPKPSQALIDAGGGVAFLERRAELRLTVSDLFDRGGQDLREFPLPGRTMLASFTYQEDTL